MQCHDYIAQYYAVFQECVYEFKKSNIHVCLWWFDLWQKKVVLQNKGKRFSLHAQDYFVKILFCR